MTLENHQLLIRHGGCSIAMLVSGRVNHHTLLAVHLDYEPQKKGPGRRRIPNEILVVSWNPGSLFHGLWNDPQITGLYFHHLKKLNNYSGFFLNINLHVEPSSGIWKIGSRGIVDFKSISILETRLMVQKSGDHQLRSAVYPISKVL